MDPLHTMATSLYSSLDDKRPDSKHSALTIRNNRVYTLLRPETLPNAANRLGPDAIFVLALDSGEVVAGCLLPTLAGGIFWQGLYVTANETAAFVTRDDGTQIFTALPVISDSADPYTPVQQSSALFLGQETMRYWDGTFRDGCTAKQCFNDWPVSANELERRELISECSLLASHSLLVNSDHNVSFLTTRPEDPANQPESHSSHCKEISSNWFYDETFCSCRHTFVISRPGLGDEEDDHHTWNALRMPLNSDCITENAVLERWHEPSEYKRIVGGYLVLATARSEPRTVRINSWRNMVGDQGDSLWIFNFSPDW
jgi:hypothetical protein